MTMPTYGLTPTGYVAPTVNECLTLFRETVEAELNVTVDWAPDTALAAISEGVSVLAGTVSEGTQAVWDGMDRNNAQGAQLDQLGALIGVYRTPATYSTCTVTLTGTAGTIVPSGSLVQGGTSDTQARWRIPSNTTITGGSVDVVVTAVDSGVVTASASTITQIVTPVAGWSAVTNAAAATPGTDIESDADYRLRQVQSVQISGAMSANALRAALLALTESGATFIESCVVIENDDATTLTLGGLDFPGHSFAPVIWPSTLTTTQKEAIALVIYANQPGGTYSAGPTTSDVTGVATVVTGTDGWPHPVRWYWAVNVEIPVVITLTLKSGYTLSDVQTAVENAVIDYFDSLAVGEPAYLLSVLVAAKAANPAAITGATATLDGVADDYDPAAVEIVQIDGGTPTVTT